MFRTSSQPAAGKRKVPNKLIAGFAALVTSALIAAGGFAAAAPADKPTKAECETAGFTNYGQCVKEWAHNKNNPGGGYGGDTNIAETNINVNLHDSDENIFEIVINNVFN